MHAVEAVAKKTVKPTTYVTVTMDDGRVVDFPGKQRMKKDVIIDGDTVKVRMDFVNGESRIFTVGDKLLLKFAGHGASQKLGDELSGLTDVEDCVMAIDELMDRLNAGDWGVTRVKGESMAGSSILARAMVEVSGKTLEEVKKFLADKNHKQKMALRNLPAIAPIIARLEAAKTKKPRDTSEADELLEGFMGDAVEEAKEAEEAE
jgi:translation initiation factor IF-1